MEIEKPSAKKRVRIYEEDEVSIASYKISDYINNKVSKNNDNKSIYIASVYSAHDPERSFAPV